MLGRKKKKPVSESDAGAPRAAPPETARGEKTERPQPRANTGEFGASFEREIAQQRDLLFGMALYFEGIAAWYSGQERVVARQRELFTSLIREGSRKLTEADTLLARVRDEADDETELQSYSFDFAASYSEPEKLLLRAAALVDAYGELFPGRDRGLELSKEETLQLIEVAGLRLAEAVG